MPGEELLLKAAGSALSSGMGSTPVGAIAQTAIGAGQMISGLIKQNQANKLRGQIPLNDAAQSIILQQLQDRQRAMELGSDPLTVANRNMLREGIQSGYGALRRGAGGDVGSLLSGVSNMNRMYGRNVAQLMAQQTAAREQLSGQINALTGAMAQRRLGIQRDAYLQKLAEAKQRLTYGGQNLMSGIAGGIENKDAIKNILMGNREVNSPMGDLQLDENTQYKYQGQMPGIELT